MPDAVPLYPEMPKNEYEWLHCTVMPGQTMTVYRHKMSRRCVMVYAREVAGGAKEYSTIWLPDAVIAVIKASF